jgi:4-diphosphocytidyl-2-C-methyl-D-erythritol kinase
MAIPGSTRVLVHCHAKVNLALSIGGPRPDGLHPIASWFVTIDLHDELAVEATAGDSTFHIAYADDAPQASAIDWPIEKDLTCKALRLLERFAGRPLATRVALRKRIPAGGGLGGGSSDAAGMLVALDQVHGLGLGEAKLIELASQLGCDVPFFVAALHGQPSAIVLGAGEIIEPVPREHAIHLLLILPGLHCPTGEVYRTFDALRPDAPPPDEARVRALAASSQLSPAMPFNDLAEPALVVRPELRTLRDAAADLLRREVHVSGSGSTLFAVAADRAEADALGRSVREALQLPAVAVATL